MHIKIAWHECRFILAGLAMFTGGFGAGLFGSSAPSVWIGQGIGILGMVFVVFFFRDPDRAVPSDTESVLAPADGRIVSIDQVSSPLDAEKTMHRISIFLSLFDVHVNRIPISGRVAFLKYHPGGYHPAMTDKASLCNEQMWIGIQSPYGTVLFKQIAGLMARRIVCRLAIGQSVTAGERFGMIRFGSRMEVYIPDALQIRTGIGRRVRAGETLLAGGIE